MPSFKLDYLTNYIVNKTLRHLLYTFIINPLITVQVRRTTSEAELRVCLTLRLLMSYIYIYIWSTYS